MTQGIYLEYMPPMKAAFEDRALLIPAHVDVVDDLRQIKLIRGIPMVPSDVHTKGADGLKRHGDFAVALMLAYAASKLPPTDFSYRAVARQTAMDARDRQGVQAEDQPEPGRLRMRPGDRPTLNSMRGSLRRREGTCW